MAFVRSFAKGLLLLGLCSVAVGFTFAATGGSMFFLASPFCTITGSLLLPVQKSRIKLCLAMFFYASGFGTPVELYSRYSLGLGKLCTFRFVSSIWVAVDFYTHSNDGIDVLSSINIAILPI